MKANTKSSTDPIPVFVLTLHRSQDRQTAFSRHADSIGLDFVFVHGTDAKELDQCQLDSAIDPASILANKHRPLTPGEIACAMSHRTIYQQVLGHGHAGALILEDDVEVTKDITAFIDELRHAAASRLIGDEVIYLGGREGFEDCRIALSLWSRLPWGTQFVARRVLRSEHGIQRTCGYFISRRACEILLDRERRIVDVADAWERRIRSRILQSLWMTLTPMVHHPHDLSASLIETDRALLLQSHRSRTGERHPFARTQAWQACIKLLRRTLYFPLLRISR